MQYDAMMPSMILQNHFFFGVIWNWPIDASVPSAKFENLWLCNQTCVIDSVSRVVFLLDVLNSRVPNLLVTVLVSAKMY